MLSLFKSYISTCVENHMMVLYAFGFCSIKLSFADLSLKKNNNGYIYFLIV